MKLSNLFGPLALIIGKQIVDTMKFLVLLILFILGFTMLTMALNLPYEEASDRWNCDVGDERTEYYASLGMASLYE